MKKSLLTLTLLVFLSCKSQNIIVKDLSKNNNLNYYFSRINLNESFNRSLFKESLFLNIFILSDPKTTSNKSISEGTEEFFSSCFISISPDGEYYTTSKLIKIENIVNPKILDIYEGTYPYFYIKMEYGNYNKRKIKNFKFKVIDE